MFGTMWGNLEPGLFGSLRQLETELDQLLGRSPYPTGIRAVPRGTFPPTNVGSTPERVDVYLFAAGLDPASVDVSIQQNLLTVAGSRKVSVNPDADYYRRERYDGEFRRAVALPDDVDPERVEAKYRDGVLHITIGRRQPARPRQVQVQ